MHFEDFHLPNPDGEWPRLESLANFAFAFLQATEVNDLP